MSKYSPYISMGVKAARAIRQGYKAYRSYTKTSQKKSGKSNDVYTTQYDRSVIYRKRKMPRYKKRAWKRFSRKVQAVTSKSKGLQTVVFTNTLDSINSLGSAGQFFHACHLYGKNGYDLAPADTGCSDLKKIWDQYPAQLTKYPSNNVHFRQAILTSTIYNSGSWPLDVDIYHIRWGEDQYGVPTFLKAHDYISGDTGDMTITPNAFLRFKGTTLFDCSELLSRYNIKIVKMTRVNLGVGQSTQYQIRNPRNKVVAANEVFKPLWTLGGSDPDPSEDNKELVYSGLTESVIIVYRPMPSVTAQNCKITVTATRTYRFVVDELAGPFAEMRETN